MTLTIPWYLVRTVAVLVVVMTFVSTSRADVRWEHNGRRSRPVWIQYASDPHRDDPRSDPLQFIFKDKFYHGADIARDENGNAVTDHTCGALEHRFRCQVQQLYEDLWDGSRIPSKYHGASDWYNHDHVNGPRPSSGSDKACAEHRLAALFPTPPGFQPYDLVPENNGGTGSTSNSCLFNQYHARFWVDSAHQDVQPAHDDLGSWTLGGFHHDHVSCDGLDCGHTLDVGWDQAVDAMMHAMHRVCQRRRWGIYPGARHTYQGLHWSGRLNRLTTRRTRDGCTGA